MVSKVKHKKVPSKDIEASTKRLYNDAKKILENKEKMKYQQTLQQETEELYRIMKSSQERQKSKKSYNLIPKVF